MLAAEDAMGIKGLSRLISDVSPEATTEHKNITSKYFEGRKICVDASMAIYQVRRAAPFSPLPPCTDF